MKKMPLYEALKAYINKNTIHFDVPGHKRYPKENILKEFMEHSMLELDVSSAKPVDSIGNPQGPIKDASQLMARAFFSDTAFFMVNGTTSGVQNMITASVKPRDKIILPRNIHKSAMNALILSGAEPIYMEPVIDEELGVSHGVTMETVKNTIYHNKDAKSILIINPTYYGVTSDLEGITRVAHDNDMTVLCDEAHGGHFYFNKSFPVGGMEIGADMSAVSLHKTCGSLTQSSVLLCHKKYLDISKVKKMVDLTQTTSPSYLLLSSLDVARYLLEEKGEELLEEALQLANYSRQKINEIGGYYVIGKEVVGKTGIFNIDETKLSIHVSNIGLTGIEVYDLLRGEYNIQVEIGEVHTIMAIVSIGDKKEWLDTLIFALKDIKERFATSKKIKSAFLFSRPQMVVTPREAFYANKKAIPLKDSMGEVSGESVMAYPPGIPIVAPGEKITMEIINHIEFLKNQDCILTGLEDPKIEYIYILGN